MEGSSVGRKLCTYIFFLYPHLFTIYIVKLSYDYPLDGDTLQVEDEEIKLLKFRKGDIINVYEQDTSGWYAITHLYITICGVIISNTIHSCDTGGLANLMMKRCAL